MLNPSDPSSPNPAEMADVAQIWRSGGAFGAVAFYEGASPGPERVQVDLGYADCLPLLGGGVWRDPASAITAETMK